MVAGGTAGFSAFFGGPCEVGRGVGEALVRNRDIGAVRRRNLRRVDLLSDADDVPRVSATWIEIRCVPGSAT